jgi:hypothetical protein
LPFTFDIAPPDCSYNKQYSLEVNKLTNDRATQTVINTYLWLSVLDSQTAPAVVINKGAMISSDEGWYSIKVKSILYTQ